MGKKSMKQSEEDQVYNPNERTRNQKNKAHYKSKFNSSTWTIDEQKLYVEFLILSEQKFQDIQSRKKLKMFVQMCDYIKSRGSQQCRSHHQKMLLKYQTKSKIIQEIPKQKGFQCKLYRPDDKFEQPTILQEKKWESFQEQFYQKPQQILHKQGEISQVQNDQVERESRIWGFIDNNCWIL